MKSAREIPRAEVETIVDNIGLPSSGINLAFGDSSTIGVSDGEILIALNRRSTARRKSTSANCVRGLNDKFPQETFYFQAANITNQILNFGLPAPIDVQVVGRDAKNNYKIAKAD